MGDQELEFAERWRDNAYGCFSSGHKFCREVCPVMQVTRNENHTPTAFHASIVAMEKGLRRGRGRRRRLRPLHPVRRVRAALPEHADDRRLLPPPHPHRRRREGDAGADGRDRERAGGLEAVERAARARTTTSRCWATSRVCQEHVADWAIGLDIPIGGETILFVDCEAAFYRTSYTRAFAQLLQMAGYEFGLMREQWCCGGPAAEMGYRRPRAQARHPQRRGLARGRRQADHRARPARLHRLHRGLPQVLRRRLRVRDRARRRAGQRPRARTARSSSRTPSSARSPTTTRAG